MYIRTFITTSLLLLTATATPLTFADAPACAIQCTLQVLPTSPCTLDNTTCICTNAPLAQSLGSCMLANCTMLDSLHTSRVQASVCNLPRESRRTQMFLATSIIYAVAFVSVALRLAGKIAAKRLGWDDAFVVASVLITAIPMGSVLAGTARGFGEHAYGLEDRNLKFVMRTFFTAGATYVLTLGMIKISIVLFYLEIFRSRSFRITAYIIIPYIAINSIIVFLVSILSCRPFEFFWNRDIPGGKCLDYQATSFAISGSAIAQDFILLVLPLVFIRGLTMRRWKKVAVGFMFSVGTFGCIATLIRLRTLMHFSRVTLDPTWDYVPVTIWTELELAASFVCVSLPSIRLLIVRLVPARVKKWMSLRLSRNSARKHTPPSPVSPPERKKPRSWINISEVLKDSRGSEEPDFVEYSKESGNSDMAEHLDSAPVHDEMRAESIFIRFWRRHANSNSPSSTNYASTRNTTNHLATNASAWSESYVPVRHPLYHVGEKEVSGPPQEPARALRPWRQSVMSLRSITALPEFRRT